MKTAPQPWVEFVELVELVELGLQKGMWVWLYETVCVLWDLAKRISKVSVMDFLFWKKERVGGTECKWDH